MLLHFFSPLRNAPVVGPEISSTPVRFFTGQPAAPAAPLALDGNGFVLAFSTAAGTHARTVVTRLDAQA